MKAKTIFQPKNMEGKYLMLTPTANFDDTYYTTIIKIIKVGKIKVTYQDIVTSIFPGDSGKIEKMALEDLSNWQYEVSQKVMQNMIALQKEEMEEHETMLNGYKKSIDLLKQGIKDI